MASTALKQAAKETAVTGKTDGPSIIDLIRRSDKAIARALPSHVSPERMIRTALTEVRRNPRLQECSSQSLLGALMQSAQLGLELGPLGLAYLVPYKSGKTGGYECQLIIGYKGIIDLARRSGNIESIVAHAVHEGDEFDVRYGLDDTITHVPNLRGERGNVWCYYAVAKYVGGGHTFWVMTRDEIDERRKRSKADKSGPWVTDYDAMARKTVVRSMAAYLPLTVEAAKAITTDEAVFNFDDTAESLTVVEQPAIETTGDEK